MRVAGEGGWRFGGRAVSVLGLSILGGVLSALGTGSTGTFPAADMAGLRLSVERIVWVEGHMEHERGIPMPASMMPDMPVAGQHRLSVEVALHNQGPEPQGVRAEAFELRSSDGKRWPPVLTAGEAIRLAVGRRVRLFLHFDVPAGAPGLRLVWQGPAAERIVAAVPAPAAHGGRHRHGQGH